jgi:serine/threonine protein kinase
LALENEIEILKEVDHPNIVKLFEAFEDDLNYYLVMEPMPGGELFDNIMKKECYTEAKSKEIIKPIIDAINYCHQINVVHRNIKPENLLYSEKDLTKAIIKVSDFGLARFV